jgi:phospholipase C
MVLRKAFLAIAVLTSQALFAQQFTHIVIVVQENRTPDNLFGYNPTFEPGVDIGTAGMDLQNQAVPLAAIPFTECYDLPHSHASFVKEFNKGQMNGWSGQSAAGKPGCVPATLPAYKYVDNSDGSIQPYFDIATSGGFANYFFQSNQGPSYPAHQFLISGTSAVSDTSDILVRENPYDGSRGSGCTSVATAWVYTISPTGAQGTTFPCFTRSSIFDLLEEAGLTWTYYGAKPEIDWGAPESLTGYYQSPNIVLTPPQILKDIKNCNLSNAVWVTPTSHYSDHPGGAPGGPAWVASIVNAVLNNPMCADGELYWQNTAILITWDDWGGWYDHVVPPASTASCPPVYCEGFRVPLLVSSAYTPAGYVSNTVFDFGSILNFVESNFSLPCINNGEWSDCTSAGLAEFFTGPETHAPPIAAKPFVDDGDEGSPDDDIGEPEEDMRLCDTCDKRYLPSSPLTRPAAPLKQIRSQQ